MNDPVRLTQCNNRLEAEMLQSLLKSAGIESFVTADDAGGMYGGFKFGLSAAGSAHVMVAENDLEAAQKVLATPAP